MGCQFSREPIPETFIESIEQAFGISDKSVSDIRQVRLMILLSRAFDRDIKASASRLFLNQPIFFLKKKNSQNFLYLFHKNSQ